MNEDSLNKSALLAGANSGPSIVHGTADDRADLPTESETNNGGWFKWHRKTIRSKTWNHKNPAVQKFWDYCLASAAHQEHATPFGTDSIVLDPGQFVFGRRKAASECKLSEQCIRTCIKLLKKWQNLTTNSTSAGTIVTICNWESYQGCDYSANQQSNPRPTHGQPTANPQPTHSQPLHKNVKNEKNGEKGKTNTFSVEPKIDFDAEGITWLNISESLLAIWKTTYPAIDVIGQLKKAAAWVDANPKQRKSNWKRFLVNWLCRAQDQSRPSTSFGKEHTREPARTFKPGIDLSPEALERRSREEDGGSGGD